MFEVLKKWASFRKPNIVVEFCVLDNELYPQGISPAIEGDAGVDLRLSSSVSIPPLSEAMVGSGVKVHVGSRGNKGLVGLVVPRSSCRKYGVGLGNTVGIIDLQYQGEIRLSIRNLTNAKVDLERGLALFQLIVLPYHSPVYVEVPKFSAETDRGEKGFGSTGK